MQTLTFLESRVQQALNKAEECTKNLNEKPDQAQEAQEYLNDAQLSLDEIKNVIGLVSAQDAVQVNKRYSELKNQYDTIASYFQQVNNRNQLLQGHSNSDKSIDASLDSSLQYTQEANQIGTQILDNLGKQREKLLHTNDNLEEISTSVEETSGIVHRMKNVQNRKKLLFWIVVGLLILSIILLLYITF